MATDGADLARAEQAVRERCDAGDYGAGATLALKEYGAEIFGFLLAVHRDETVAGDAFAVFAEGFWRGLPQFSWRSTLRTWAYSVARHASSNVRRDAGRRNKRFEQRSDSAIAEIAAKVRTQTLEFLRTETRSRLEALRDSLSEDDRALLILRVDRGLAWNELALVLAAGDAPVDEAERTREAARLRKRFQLVKERLRELARREKLIE